MLCSLRVLASYDYCSSGCGFTIGHVTLREITATHLSTLRNIFELLSQRFITEIIKEDLSLRAERCVVRSLINEDRIDREDLVEERHRDEIIVANDSNRFR